MQSVGTISQTPTATLPYHLHADSFAQNISAYLQHYKAKWAKSHPEISMDYVVLYYGNRPLITDSPFYEASNARWNEDIVQFAVNWQKQPNPSNKERRCIMVLLPNMDRQTLENGEYPKFFTKETYNHVSFCVLTPSYAFVIDFLPQEPLLLKLYEHLNRRLCGIVSVFLSTSILCGITSYTVGRFNFAKQSSLIGYQELQLKDALDLATVPESVLKQAISNDDDSHEYITPTYIKKYFKYKIDWKKLHEMKPNIVAKLLANSQSAQYVQSLCEIEGIDYKTIKSTPMPSKNYPEDNWEGKISQILIFFSLITDDFFINIWSKATLLT